jgi:uncharacterized Zn finger protein (UPF0148 family)
MYSTACPSCGAPVTFRSAASVMAVCGYCRATLLREADAVRDIGKMAEAMEDYSPIQVGTSGTWNKRPFGVVGRIQLRYDDGGWNEWFIAFEDGGTGWLSDGSGQYTVTLDHGTILAPAFESLGPGQSFIHSGVDFVAADIRRARCTGGAGELPFRVGDGWEAKVADFRAGDRFLTLDYSDGAPTRLYLGQAATLEALQCQLLRSEEDIQRSAGRLRGAIVSLACPGCGAPLAYPAGVASQLVCPACATRTDVSGDQAVVLGKERENRTRATTLALGDQAKIDGTAYLLIGLMRCREVGESETWTEYLLYNAKRGFLWLVESTEGWERVRVLDRWPESAGNTATVQGRSYDKRYDYGSQVIYAAGAFNWRVQVGDKVTISDFGTTNKKLSRERSDNEITWSLAESVPATVVGGWFGKSLQEAASTGPAASLASMAGERGALVVPAIWLSGLFLLLNLPIAFAGDDDNWLVVVFALWLIWWPILAKNKSGD